MSVSLYVSITNQCCICKNHIEIPYRHGLPIGDAPTQAVCRLLVSTPPKHSYPTGCRRGSSTFDNDQFGWLSRHRNLGYEEGRRTTLYSCLDLTVTTWQRHRDDLYDTREDTMIFRQDLTRPEPNDLPFVFTCFVINPTQSSFNFNQSLQTWIPGVPWSGNVLVVASVPRNGQPVDFDEELMQRFRHFLTR